jgi:hypothetical protein
LLTITLSNLRVVSYKTFWISPKRCTESRTSNTRIMNQFLQFNYFSINQLQYTCLSVFLEFWEGLWYPWKWNKLYSLRLEILSNTKSKILSSQPGEFETALRQRICSHKLMTPWKVANKTTRLLLYSLVLYSCWKLSFLLMKGTVQPFDTPFR